MQVHIFSCALNDPDSISLFTIHLLHHKVLSGRCKMKPVIQGLPAKKGGKEMHAVGRLQVLTQLISL